MFTALCGVEIQTVESFNSFKSINNIIPVAGTRDSNLAVIDDVG